MHKHKIKCAISFLVSVLYNLYFKKIFFNYYFLQIQYLIVFHIQELFSGLLTLNISQKNTNINDISIHNSKMLVDLPTMYILYFTSKILQNNKRKFSISLWLYTHVEQQPPLEHHDLFYINRKYNPLTKDHARTKVSIT